jgi:hypothetical protein
MRKHRTKPSLRVSSSHGPCVALSTHNRVRCLRHPLADNFLVSGNVPTDQPAIVSASQADDLPRNMAKASSQKPDRRVETASGESHSGSVTKTGFPTKPEVITAAHCWQYRRGLEQSPPRRLEILLVVPKGIDADPGCIARGSASRDTHVQGALSLLPSDRPGAP